MWSAPPHFHAAETDLFLSYLWQKGSSLIHTHRECLGPHPLKTRVHVGSRRSVHVCDLMFSSNPVNLPGCVCVCQMRLVMVVNISAGHKHVWPHFNQESSCVSMHVCVSVCVCARKTINKEEKNEGACAASRSHSSVRKIKSFHKRQKQECKMKRKNARKCQVCAFMRWWS